MTRPRSDAKRSAIMAAAIRVIALQGLDAATATIAREAGVSTGSLFTYFATKADLLNQLFILLKMEMGEATAQGLPARSSVRTQLQHAWRNWLNWAVSSPEKRRALAHLSVCNEITAETRIIAQRAMFGLGELLERSRKHGPMRNVSIDFLSALAIAMADATMDFMIDDPGNADKHCAAAFEALWRALA